MELNEVIKHIDAVTISDKAVVAQLKHEEDGEPYQVWKIDCGNVVYILKEAKESEAETYSTILAALETDCIPALYQVISAEEKTFLLMEYAEGRRPSDRLPFTVSQAFLYPHLGQTPFSLSAMPQRGQRSMLLWVLNSAEAAFTPLVKVILAMLSLSLSSS